VPEPILRDAREEDLDLLLPMMEDFYRNEGIAWDAVGMRAAAAKLLSEPSLGRVVLVVLDAEAIGYAVLTWGYDLEFGGRDAFLTEIYVRRDLRGSGWGRRLLEEIETIARASGVGAIHLEVRPDNTPAVGLYREAGFATTGRTFLSKRLPTP
jgi:ribosomal protein S18 acetylase RimI-like enzyme